jgi:hypothetical protein
MTQARTRTMIATITATSAPEPAPSRVVGDGHQRQLSLVWRARVRRPIARTWSSRRARRPNPLLMFRCGPQRRGESGLPNLRKGTPSPTFGCQLREEVAATGAVSSQPAGVTPQREPLSVRGPTQEASFPLLPAAYPSRSASASAAQHFPQAQSRATKRPRVLLAIERLLARQSARVARLGRLATRRAHKPCPLPWPDSAWERNSAIVMGAPSRTGAQHRRPGRSRPLAATVHALRQVASSLRLRC